MADETKESKPYPETKQEAIAKAKMFIDNGMWEQARIMLDFAKFYQEEEDRALQRIKPNREVR